LPIFKSIEKGIQFGLRGMQHRVSLCYVHDLVSALVMAGAREDLPSGEVFFVSDGYVHTWKDVGTTIARAMGVRPIYLGLPVRVFRWCAGLSDWVSRRSGRPHILSKERYQEMIHPNWCCDSSKATVNLGFSPSFDLKRGIAETVKWYRAQGWLRS
jgi:nucleoside-diphosphate-sugar epimerase